MFSGINHPSSDAAGYAVCRGGPSRQDARRGTTPPSVVYERRRSGRLFQGHTPDASLGSRSRRVERAINHAPDFRWPCRARLPSSIRGGYLRREPAWSAIPTLATELFIVSSDYDAPDADHPERVCDALKWELGVAVVPVPKAGTCGKSNNRRQSKELRASICARGFETAARSGCGLQHSAVPVTPWHRAACRVPWATG